jgi:hypothetical protein
VKAPALFRVHAPTADGAPKVEAISPTGERQRLAAQETVDAEGAAWNVSFAPASTGNWEVQASDSLNHTARVVFPVTDKAGSIESLNLPTDVAGMRQLAESTGGALVARTPVFQPPTESAEKPRVKRTQPLWNSGWLLGALLGMYGVELIVRRCFGLL